MESYITAIKDERNNSMHGLPEITTQEFFNKAHKLRKLFHEALRTAKIKYQVSDAGFNDIINIMNDKLDEAMLEVLGEKDLLSFNIGTLRQDLIQESNKVMKQHFLNSLNIDPMSFLTDTKLNLHVEKVFTEITMTRGSTGVRRDLRYENIIKDTRSGLGSSQSQVLLVEGIAGSGKTTFIKLVIGEWLKENKDRIITGLDYYDLLLCIQCRERKIDSLHCLLNNEVPDVFLKFRNLVLHLIKNCKILFLIDGLDESNEDSEKLIDDILTQMKTVNGCTLLFTSRPEGFTSFKSNIPQEYQVSCLEIIGIPEASRASFVRRYHEEIKQQIGDTKNTEELVENVQQVLEREHFRLPLNMVFLTWIYIHDPCAITTTTTQTQLYHSTYQLCLQKLLNRLTCHTTTRNSDRQTLETNLKQPMGAIQKESLVALWRSRVTFDHEAETSIREACSEQNIPTKELFSAFLTLKANRTHLREIAQYSAPHKGLQEFYAAMHIVTHPRLQTSSASIRDILEETLGKINEKLGRIQYVLYHVAGMLPLQPNPVPHTITNELLDMLFDSGMNVREQWLNLVEDTRANTTVLQRIAHYFCASISERDMLEELEEKLERQEKKEQKRQEEKKKEREKKTRGKKWEANAGNENKNMEFQKEHINVDKNKEKEIEMENDFVKKDEKKKITKERYGNKDSNILPVLIRDSRLESLIALLPLLSRTCDVRVEFENDPGLHTENLLSAISSHTCISMTVMSHFKEPDPAVTTDHLMKQVLPR
ncbi:NACHT, LRR and PYD domains-containing protein 3 [Portunus trituberculatus]|uniref:NACHT, LRR and PYD domains-containing protein 3 n=1 Tax=Portunus trituberculatus TaxID=210409 RepID=A0A5B7GL94_PORTR|nr:NACHT, LRR and PYD domains-containing protein 3 [Portunus trituberculatus]